LPHQEYANKLAQRYLGIKIHQYVWFMISGFMCDCCQAVIDYFISTIYVFEWEKVTVCWTLSYCASICVRHISHRYLVFGEYEGTYCQSLSKVYLAYLSSIILSTICNHSLVNYVGLAHRTAWLSTMIWIGVFNYFALKNVWRKDKLEAPDKAVMVVGASETVGLGSPKAGNGLPKLAMGGSSSERDLLLASDEGELNQDHIV
jgi:hypothetical protein